MEVRTLICVLLGVTLVSGYSTYRMRPVRRSVYQQYINKYRGYSGYQKQRPYVRSLGQFIGRDVYLQRSLPRYQNGYQKGDRYYQKGSRGIGIRPIPIQRVPLHLRPYRVRSFRPSPIRCNKYETLFCSPAPYHINSGKCFSICRNGKPCYKPCSCKCLPYRRVNLRSVGKSNLLPLGKKPAIPFCVKTHRLRCRAREYSMASDVLCISACTDGICPLSCNCQCVADRPYKGTKGLGGGGGFPGGFREDRGNFWVGRRGGLGGMMQGNGGFVNNDDVRFISGRGGRRGGFDVIDNGIDTGRLGQSSFGRGMGFDVDGFNGGGPGIPGGGVGIRNGGRGFGGVGIDSGIDIGLGTQGGLGIGEPGIGGGGGAFVGGGGGGGGGALGVRNGALGGDGGNGFGNGVDIGDGLGIQSGLGIGDPGIGGALGGGGGGGIVGGGGNGFGNGVNDLGISGLNGGTGVRGDFLAGFPNDLGISNDVVGTERDFRLFPSNAQAGLGLDANNAFDLSQLQNIDRLDIPLDGSQDVLEPELSLMDSIPDLNGPELIDPGLEANVRGGFIGIEAPDVGPVGLDPTALQELGGLVGGPFDPIMDVGAGRGTGGAPSQPKKESKKPKKVTETVDIKVDVIKKGSPKDKVNGKGKKPSANGSGSNIPIGIPGGTQQSNVGLRPGDIVDPSHFLGGAGGGVGDGILDRGLLDSGGMPGNQGGGPPIGILVDGPSSRGIMGNAGNGGLPGGFRGGSDGFGGHMDPQNGRFDGLALDTLPNQGNGHSGFNDGQGNFDPQGQGANGKGHSGIIGFNDGQGNFDPQAGHMDGFGLDSFPPGALDAVGSGQKGGSGRDGGGQMFDTNGLFEPIIQSGTGFNDQMTFEDPTQPNNGPGGGISFTPDSQNGAGSVSGGNINLDLSSLLGGLDLSSVTSGGNGQNTGGSGPAGGVIGLADMAGGIPADVGGAAIGGSGKETMDSCLSRGEQLWCDVRPSWGGNPGVQGWCNSNCQKGACNFDRCACSCISGAEYDFRMNSSGSKKF